MSTRIDWAGRSAQVAWEKARESWGLHLDCLDRLQACLHGVHAFGLLGLCAHSRFHMGLEGRVCWCYQALIRAFHVNTRACSLAMRGGPHVQHTCGPLCLHVGL